jgi:uncharacterized protein YqgC (DUF456 family)
MIKAVQYGLGIGLILVGIAGLFLPFLQGVLLIILGVFVLRAHSIKSAWITIKEKVTRKK